MYTHIDTRARINELIRIYLVFQCLNFILNNLKFNELKIIFFINRSRYVKRKIFFCPIFLRSHEYKFHLPNSIPVFIHWIESKKFSFHGSKLTCERLFVCECVCAFVFNIIIIFLLNIFNLFFLFFIYFLFGSMYDCLENYEKIINKHQI